MTDLAGMVEASLPTDRLLDHLVGAGKKHGRHLDAKRLGDLEVDDETKFYRSLNRKFGLVFHLTYIGAEFAKPQVRHLPAGNIVYLDNPRAALFKHWSRAAWSNQREPIAGAVLP